MKSRLLHLPSQKVKELKKIVDLITDQISIEKIILFGSHARGDWVTDKYREGHITYAYESDFDILVIVASEKTKNDVLLWDEIKQQIFRDPDILTTVNMIIDTSHFVNEKISEGNYFYNDIKSEGIVLFDAGNFQFVEPKTLPPDEKKELMQTDCNFWISKGRAFLKDYKHNITDGELNNAAFHISQAVESFYFAVLVVFTGYKPKSHNIEKIESLVSELVPAIGDVFPKVTEKQKELHQLLVHAYIDARYSKDYSVTMADLSYLYEKTEKLAEVVENVCERKIASIEVVN